MEDIKNVRASRISLIVHILAILASLTVISYHLYLVLSKEDLRMPPHLTVIFVLLGIAILLVLQYVFLRKYLREEEERKVSRKHEKELSQVRQQYENRIADLSQSYDRIIKMQEQGAEKRMKELRENLELDGRKHDLKVELQAIVRNLRDFFDQADQHSFFSIAFDGRMTDCAEKLEILNSWFASFFERVFELEKLRDLCQELFRIIQRVQNNFHRSIVEAAKKWPEELPKKLPEQLKSRYSTLRTKYNLLIINSLNLFFARVIQELDLEESWECKPLPALD